MTASDEPSRVAEWLAKQGYPLELRVGQILRKAGWRVQHARWYTDPDSGKARETDIVAELWESDQGKPQKSVCIQLVVECKSSQDKPWVVFSAPQERLPLLLRDTAVADRYSRDALWAAGTRKIKLPSLLTGWKALGHGVVRAHTDGKTGDPTSPFAALHAVVSAATALGREHADFALAAADHWFSSYVVVPLIVLDGSLYQYSLTDESKEHLQPIHRIAVPVMRQGDWEQTNVTVVTYSSFDAYTEEVTPDAIRFAGELLPHTPEIAAFLASRTKKVGRDRPT
jgi:hypothetical protein